jgi:hypothetical protein
MFVDRCTKVDSAYFPSESHDLFLVSTPSMLNIRRNTGTRQLLLSSLRLSLDPLATITEELWDKTSTEIIGKMNLEEHFECSFDEQQEATPELSPKKSNGDSEEDYPSIDALPGNRPKKRTTPQLCVVFVVTSSCSPRHLIVLTLVRRYNELIDCKTI